MTEHAETPSTTVPAGAKQVEETGVQSDWVESAVWTERMLTALEKGVKGGVWFSLIDKVCSKRNLRASFAKVKANKGSAGTDRVTIEMFEQHLEMNLNRLHAQLKDGSYRPQAIHRTRIPKPGKRKETRPLGIPTVRDRVVQTALRSVLEPIFEKDFAANSFGFRPDRSCKDALRTVQELLNQEYTYVVDADLQNYFETISHKRLLHLLRQRIADGRVLQLVEQFLQQKVMEGIRHWTPESGTPQGAVISPLLSNIYLNELDHLMIEMGYQMVRYADDLVILCRTREQSQGALDLLDRWVRDAGLTLHPEKTCVVDAITEGFEFLGYHFHNHTRRASGKSCRKLKDALRRKTCRSRGQSMETIIGDVNRTLRGWFAYYKHSHPWTFGPLDAWLRVRLRSILRRHHKKKGGAWRGVNNQLWPNAYFADLGLFSLKDARAAASQSACR
jgi:RNA-directed DNA polymerase